MVSYMAIPNVRVTFGSTVTDGLIDGNIEMAENNYWKADLTFANAPAIYPSIADVGTSVLIEVRDEAIGGAWTTLFTGTVLTPDINFNASQATVKFICVHLGYALNMMNVSQEYGLQSNNGIDTITWIINDSSFGILNRWINSYEGGYQPSGYAITDACENISGSIPYIMFPCKPANKCIDDLCDFLTAKNGTGPQWIVDHLGNLRVRTIGTSQGGWTKYYGNSQANATLVNGEDFFDGDFQAVGTEANVIKYYGVWRRPSSGDAWTETGSSLWGKTEAAVLLDYYTSNKIVGVNCLRAKTSANPNGQMTIWYPSARTAAWNFYGFSEFNTPNLNFYVYLDNPSSSHLYVYLCTDATNYFTVDLQPTQQTWQHFSLPIGPYFNVQQQTATKWSVGMGNPQWNNINWVEFYITSLAYNSGAGTTGLLIDGLHFGSASICRIARQCFPTGDAHVGTLGTATNPVKYKVLHDDIGKDDSLLASDDTGLIAQMAKSALLQGTKPTVNGKFTTPMIKDILPGQFLYIGKDWRITKLTHSLASFQTSFEVTDDLTNSHSRLRFEDKNKVAAANRPEYQDRQATSIKSGNIDIRVLPLETAYNI